MTDIKASDLPVGSLVANDHTAWIKTVKEDDDMGHWIGTGDELGTYDDYVQEALDAGATVYREGGE